MVSKRELQFRLDASLSTARKYEKALRKAAEHLNCPISYFDAYSLGDFIKDLETVANEKTATEARKRLGLDKPEETKTSKVERNLREISDLSITPLPMPDYYKDLGTKKEGPVDKEWDLSGWSVGPKVKDPGINYSVFKGKLDSLTKRVAYMEAFGWGPPTPERAVTHGVRQSYSEGGYIKKPKPRYRLEAIPCTKPQEYRIVPIEEEK